MINNDSNAAAAAAPPALPPLLSYIDPVFEIDFINCDIGSPQRQSYYGVGGVKINCCAHDDCGINPTIAHEPVTRLHSCHNCILYLHAPLTCGETLPDILLLDEDKYDLRYFSDIGKSTLEDGTRSTDIPHIIRYQSTTPLLIQ